MLQRATKNHRVALAFVPSVRVADGSRQRSWTYETETGNYCGWNLLLERCGELCRGVNRPRSIWVLISTLLAPIVAVESVDVRISGTNPRPWHCECSVCGSVLSVFGLQRADDLFPHEIVRGCPEQDLPWMA